MHVFGNQMCFWVRGKLQKICSCSALCLVQPTLHVLRSDMLWLFLSMIRKKIKLYVTFYRVIIFNYFVGEIFYLLANHDEGIFAIFDGGYFRHIELSLFLTVLSDLIGKINDKC